MKKTRKADVNVKAGDRIELVWMGTDEPNPIPSGTRGTVVSVEECPTAGARWTQIDVDWDIDRSLMLVVPGDTFKVIEEA